MQVYVLSTVYTRYFTIIWSHAQTVHMSTLSAYEREPGVEVNKS